MQILPSSSLYEAITTKNDYTNIQFIRKFKFKWTESDLNAEKTEKTKKTRSK